MRLETSIGTIRDGAVEPLPLDALSSHSPARITGLDTSLQVVGMYRADESREAPKTYGAFVVLRQ